MKISVLIPVRNGAVTLQALLSSISEQTLAVDEIIVADSESTDNSAGIAASFGAVVVPVTADEFDHGGTRAMMARRASGDLLIYFTQDAIPADGRALEKLVEPLLRDGQVASSFGRQLPAPDATCFAASLRAFNYPDADASFSRMSREQYGLRTVFTSNSFACYRKCMLKEVSWFRENLLFGEDTLAVGRLLQRGYIHCYAAGARVYHSHNYTVVQEFKRYFDIGVLHRRERWLLETFGSTSGRSRRYILHELRGLRADRKLYLLPELVVRLGVKFVAYKLGRAYMHLPYRFVTLCSMNPRWWKKQMNSKG